MSKKVKTPPPPDYAGIAKQEAQIDAQTYDRMISDSRANQVNPWGSQTWTKTPLNGGADRIVDGVNFGPDYEWTMTSSLSPEQQKIFDAENASKISQSSLLQALTDRAKGSMGQPIDTAGLQEWQLSDSGGFDLDKFLGIGSDAAQINLQNNVGQLPAREQGYQLQAPTESMTAQALMERYNRFNKPEQDRQATRLRDDLISQGFSTGSEGFQGQMGRLRDQQYRQDADVVDRAVLTAGNENRANLASELAKAQALWGEARAGRGEDLNRLLAGQGEDRANLATLLAQQTADRGAYLQGTTAAAAGDQRANDLRQKQLAEALMLRSMPLQELNAFRSGSQVSLPNMTPTFTTPQLQGPELLTAAGLQGRDAMAAYNAQVAGQNSFMNGLFGLGGALLGAPTGSGGANILKMLGIG